MRATNFLSDRGRVVTGSVRSDDIVYFPTSERSQCDGHTKPSGDRVKWFLDKHPRGSCASSVASTGKPSWCSHCSCLHLHRCSALCA